VVERKSKPPIDVGLDSVLFVAELPDVLPSRERAEFGGRSVFVRPADEEDFVADLAPKSRVDVRWKKRADEIAEMLGAVDVGQRAGDEELGHGTRPSRARMPTPKTKSPSTRPEGLGSAHASRAKARTTSSGLTPCGRAGAFVAIGSQSADSSERLSGVTG
jgi:hypothetical protein